MDIETFDAVMHMQEAENPALFERVQRWKMALVDTQAQIKAGKILAESSDRVWVGDGKVGA